MHLSVYGQRPFLLHVRTCWYEENVAILQRDVGCTTRQNALHIDRDDFQGAVGLETVHDGSGGKCLLGHALGSLQQRLNGVDVAAHLILTGAEDGASHLHHIVVAGDDGIDIHGVGIRHAEAGGVKLVDVVDGPFASRLAEDAHGLRIGVARETACVADEGGEALVAFHLVVHWTLHLARDVDKAVVGSDHDHIVVGQVDVAALLTVEDVVIDVDDGDKLVVAIDLDIAERTQVADATSQVEGVEYGGKGRDGIGARRVDLTHHIDQDGVGLAH